MSHNFTPFPVLETERLTLRALNFEDAKALFGLRTNKEVIKFIDRKSLNNLSETRAFIDLISNLVTNNKGVFWVIESKSNHQLMGTISLRNFENEENYAEIGYELDPTYHQRGFMSEAFDKILNFGFHPIHPHPRQNHPPSLDSTRPATASPPLLRSPSAPPPAPPCSRPSPR